LKVSEEVSTLVSIRYILCVFRARDSVFEVTN